MSSEDIASGLADRLTQNLTFIKGESVAGGPPPYHEGSDWPQVEFVDPPQQTVRLGDSFEMDIKAIFDSPQQIDGAMVWVKDSNFHIDIRDSVNLDTMKLHLEAKLLSDPELAGKTFDLYVSLYLGAETGLHETWRIEIPEE